MRLGEGDGKICETAFINDVLYIDFARNNCLTC